MADNFTPLDVNKPTEQENGGEKNALSADEPTSLKDQLFTGVNKYLMLLMGIFIVVIIVALFISFQRGQKAQEEELPQTKSAQEATTDTVKQQQVTRSSETRMEEQTPPVNLNEYLSSSTERPFNVLAFEDLKNKPNGSRSYTVESRFHGVVLAVDDTAQRYALQLEGKTPPFDEKTVWFAYDKSMPSNVLGIESIQVGDEVYIDEKNDLSKDYPESILSVTITKVQ